MIEVLESIGLSRNESKAYISLLELGFESAGRIARKAKLDRANTYDSLEKLKSKGLVSYILKGGTRYFEAAKPDSLKLMLKEKEQELDNILPQLSLARNMQPKTSEARTFEGLKAFKHLLKGLLEYGEPILSFGASYRNLDSLSHFFPHFHREGLMKNVPIKHLPCYKGNSMGSATSTIVCGDEVIHVMWNRNPLSIQIMNRDLAESYKKYFSMMQQDSKA